VSAVRPPEAVQPTASPLARELPPALLRWEGWFVCLLAWVLFIAIPLGQGQIGLSWDALNHHVYLGWTAEHARFDRDFVASGYQAFVYPYLYWPVYKLAAAGWSGAWAGVVLATIHLLAVPPVWMLARTCMPGTTAFDAGMRTLAVALAFLTGVVLSLFDSTANDLMAATPLVWSVAFAMQPLGAAPLRPGVVRRWLLLSGLMAGVAVTFKLSNGPLAVLLPALWMLAPGALRTRLANTLLAGAATLLGFVATYGYWGALLWQYFGNPIYPFCEDWFGPLRAWLGHAP
jgi:hypothetical protein